MRCLCCIVLTVLCRHVAAHPEDDSVDELLVFGRSINLIGKAQSSSQGLVGYADFDYRPLARAGDLLEVIPGLVATQHSGSGKSNQLYLRGFNLDHGTDFAGFIDGAPINFRTHGHGQGYLDVNFIIPELVETLAFRKGPYFSDVGDFSAAGTAAYKTYDRLDDSIAAATIGESGFVRGLVATSVGLGGGDLTIAVETLFTDSPYILDEDLEKYNGFLKYVAPLGEMDLALTLSAYRSTWNSTDQVPLRAIESGLIDRLGFIDPDLGGETTRIAFTGQLQSERSKLSVYAQYYDFALFSNFTYFASDPINGDEFEQRDERVVLGGSGHTTVPIELGDTPAALRLGGDLRYDTIFNLGLFQTAARQRLSTFRDDDVTQFSFGGFAELSVDLTDSLRLTTGVRGDVFTYNVIADIRENSGDGSQGLVTPKAALAWRVTDTIELYANYGHSFHSNDVRGAAISIDPVSGDAVDPVDVLVRAEGAELGARYGAERFNVTLTGFWLELDSELVFVGDAGTTEPNDGSRRYGVEAFGFWQVLDNIAIDVSAAYTYARFNGVDAGQDRIPQAVETVFSGGVVAQPINGLTTTLRVRHFGQAPLIEDGSVTSEPTTVVNAGFYYDIGAIRLGLDIFNLLDSEDADITYFFESQLPGEASPVEDIHLHPIEPRQVRGSVRLTF